MATRPTPRPRRRTQIVDDAPDVPLQKLLKSIRAIIPLQDAISSPVEDGGGTAEDDMSKWEAENAKLIQAADQFLLRPPASNIPQIVLPDSMRHTLREIYSLTKALQRSTKEDESYSVLQALKAAADRLPESSHSNTPETSSDEDDSSDSESTSDLEGDFHPLDRVL